MKDYYGILGVSSAATGDEIKSAYRKLAKRYHPDLNPGNQQAEERFKAVNEAYTVLGEDGSKARYDLDRRKAAQQERTRQAPKRETHAPVNAHFDISNMAQGFENFFGFDPKTGEVTNESKLNSNVKNQQNPLDMSKMFESYFGFKK